MESENMEQEEVEIGRRKRKKANDSYDIDTKYIVGMKVDEKKYNINGIFKDEYQVGKFVKTMIGDVRSVKITRGGIVIMDCQTESLRDKALATRKYGRIHVTCFLMRQKAGKKGVISGVSMFAKMEEFMKVEGVIEAIRLKRYRNGVVSESNSVLLTFEGELPMRVNVEYMSYRVREYERAPMRCFHCQGYAM